MNSFSLIAFVCLISVFCLQTEEYLLQELNVGSSALLVLTMTANQQTYAAVWHQGTCNLDASHIFDFEKSTILYHAPTFFLIYLFFNPAKKFLRFLCLISNFWYSQGQLLFSAW